METKLLMQCGRVLQSVGVLPAEQGDVFARMANLNEAEQEELMALLNQVKTAQTEAQDLSPEELKKKIKACELLKPEQVEELVGKLDALSEAQLAQVGQRLEQSEGQTREIQQDCIRQLERIVKKWKKYIKEELPDHLKKMEAQEREQIDEDAILNKWDK